MAIPRTPPVALAIAGSDSGGGAGIQADIKSFAANGVFGTTAITAITAQSTKGVSAISLTSPDMLVAQIEAVLDDFQVRAVKTGMLGSVELADVVESFALKGELPLLVVDPVMISASGDRLSEQEVVAAYRDRLAKVALVITPNVFEAQALTGIQIDNLQDMVASAKILHTFGSQYVYLKGGHLEGADAIDVLFDGSNLSYLRARRINTPNVHGTGCTFSSALAAHLARGRTVEEAAQAAKIYTSRAIAGSAGWGLGHGPGPLDHLNWAEKQY